jgi:hypothetical protein
VSTRQHSSRTVQQARNLASGGWNPRQIARLLTAEGTPVSDTTVQTWIDPDYLKRRRANEARAKAAKRAAAGVSMGRRIVNPGTRFQRMRDLRDAGLRYEDVAKVMRLDFGVELDVDQVRYALANDSMPRALKQSGLLVEALG